MDWDKMNNLYRELSIDVSYQVSVHLAKLFQRRFLEIDQLETRIACGSHHSQKSWVILLMNIHKPILVLDWSISKNLPSLKLLCQNEPTFGGKHLWKVLY
jgi:hypothetical protein